MARISSNISEKIYEELNRDIQRGQYVDGEVIPSENELAHKYKVTRFFARKALSRLEQKGLVENCPGIGRMVKARGLKLKRLGILDDHSVEFYTRHDPLMPGHVFDWQHGVFKACTETRVTSVHVTGRSQSLKERLFLLDQMMESRIDALVFKTGLHKRDEIDAFLRKVENYGIPAICGFASLDQNYDIDFFTGDYYSEGKLMCSNLIDNGHHSIAYIFGELKGEINKDNHYRYDGIVDSLREHALTIDNDAVISVPYSMFDGEWYDNGYYAISQLHDRGVLEKISGIIAINDPMADGAIFRLKELGLRVPEDISITGFDNDPRFRHLHLTTGYFSFMEDTADIIKKFINKVNNNEKGKIMELIKPKLLEGNTVRKLTNT